MTAAAARARFSAMVSLDDEDVDLLAAALLVAQEENPALSVRDEIRRVEDLADELAPHVGPGVAWYSELHALNQVFLRRVRTRREPLRIDDPSGAFLDRVLTTGQGLPVSLCILYAEIASRAGISIRGVAFPGHFLVRMDHDGGVVFLDPYKDGAMLLSDELGRRLRRVCGRDAELHPEHLEPASNKRVLLRLLANLKRCYVRRGDLDRTIAVVERLVLVDPNRLSERRDRGILYGRAGRREAAIEDLQGYLDAAPEAQDADYVRRVLVNLRSGRAAEA